MKREALTWLASVLLAGTGYVSALVLVFGRFGWALALPTAVALGLPLFVIFILSAAAFYETHLLRTHGPKREDRPTAP